MALQATMKKISVKGKEYRGRMSVRALMYYEHIRREPFENIRMMTDVIVLLYCILLTSPDEYRGSFEDFMDSLTSDDLRRDSETLGELIEDFYAPALGSNEMEAEHEDDGEGKKNA